MKEKIAPKTNDTLFGFKVTDVREIADVSAICYTMEHIGSGARLVFLERSDSNMTFSIAFKTPPEDSTGVFHIIEHSVLCGSERFPVKEPFTELLKSSLKTFLNAFTYPDRTVYPVSSRNEQDFLNLATVYLDAVFFPLATRDERIFRQEGHRLEFTEDGELSYNGVVYNEMKGAYSSPDELLGQLVNERLFPKGAYSHDSGGKPEVIPTLSYEAFCLAHKKYYHPSNSYTVLDGDIPLEKTLSLLDSYFSRFERADIEAELDTDCQIDTEPLDAHYAVEDGEEERGSRLALGWRSFSFDSTRDALALAVISDALSGDNSAPLRKRILDTGLCDAFSLSHSDGAKISTLTAKFKGIKNDVAEELIEFFDSAVSDIIDEGINEESLIASLNSFEFRTREKDYGSYPRGIIYAMSICDYWLYGAPACIGLCVSELFGQLRAAVGTGYFEALLKKVISTPRARVNLIPSDTLNEENEKRVRDALACIKSSLTREEAEAIAKASEELKKWQSAPDTDEALSTLPRLSLSDIGEPPAPTPTDIYTVDGVTVINHPIDTSGIIYTSLLFDTSDVCAPDLYKLFLFTLLFGDVKTESGEPIIINNKIKTNLGSLSVSASPVKRGGEVRFYIEVKASALASKSCELTDIIREYLLTADFFDVPSVTRKLTQIRLLLSEFVADRGSTYALSRVCAMLDPLEAALEYLGGYEAIKRLKDEEGASAEQLCEFFSATAGRVFTRDRLTLSLTGEYDGELAKRLVGLFPRTDSKPEALSVPLLEKKNEIIPIPSQVSFSAVGAHLEPEDISDLGSFAVLSNILGYELLWNEVRIKGAAYDTGFTHKHSSELISMYSYRDPSPKRSKDIFLSVPALLREFAEDTSELDGYIIGAVGESDTPLTPRQEGAVATLYFLMGRGREDMKRIRSAMLSFNKGTLLALADRLDLALKGAVSCILGKDEQ